MRSQGGGPAILVRNFGDGCVVNMSHAANYSNGSNTLQNGNIQQLYLNSVDWAQVSGCAGNSAPTAVAGGPYLVAVEATIPLDGSASSDPDEGDVLTPTWSVTDAEGGTIIGVDLTDFEAGTTAGIYEVCLTVNDGSVDSDPACAMVVVYDPDGGFVTGGGWIDSPSGAYTPDDLTVFEANFDSGVPSEFSGITTAEGVQGYDGLGTAANIFGDDF